MAKTCACSHRRLRRALAEDRQVAAEGAQDLSRQLVPQGRQRQIHLAGLWRKHARAHIADYVAHWLKIGKSLPKAPRIYLVNWFRKDASGKYIWPGYGENMRVLTSPTTSRTG